MVDFVYTWLQFVKRIQTRHSLDSLSICCMFREDELHYLNQDYNSLDLPISEKSKWYLKTAEGGYVRAMYNLSLCYSDGGGLPQNQKLARKWMKRQLIMGIVKLSLNTTLLCFRKDHC